MIGYYLHDLSPFLIRFSDNVGLRWYGLAYVAAFVVGYFLLRRFVRKGYCELRESQVGDFITLGALLGVMLGGRLGYMLLYNRDAFFANPLSFFHFLDGGMASHGGIFGLVVFTYFYARKKRVTWRGIGDNLCTVAPLGLAFGRAANFINGELYGRKSDVPWAVQFPEEVREDNFTSPTGDGHAELWLDLKPFELRDETELIEASRSSPEIQEILREYLNARHPSQIYQALMEGLALFLILYLVRVNFPRLRHGILTGIFFIGYAVFRILGEQFRQPSDGFIGPFTKGQFFSLFMVAVGLVFIASAFIWPYQQKEKSKRRRVRESDPDPPPPSGDPEEGISS